MSTEKQELLHAQTNAENHHNTNFSSEELLERENIEGSPFVIIGNEQKGYFLTLGKWRLTDSFKTKLDVILDLDKNKYTIILKMLICVINDNKTK